MRDRAMLSAVTRLLADGGYTGENSAQGVAAILGASVEAARIPNCASLLPCPTPGGGAVLHLAGKMQLA